MATKSDTSTDMFEKFLESREYNSAVSDVESGLSPVAFFNTSTGLTIAEIDNGKVPLDECMKAWMQDNGCRLAMLIHLVEGEPTRTLYAVVEEGIKSVSNPCFVSSAKGAAAAKGHRRDRVA